MSHSNLKCNVHRGQENPLSHHHKQSFQSLACRNFWIAGYREQPVPWHLQIIHRFWSWPHYWGTMFCTWKRGAFKQPDKHEIDWDDWRQWKNLGKETTNCTPIYVRLIVASPVKMDTYKSVFNGLLSWSIQVQWKQALRHCLWRPKCHWSSLDGCVAWAVYALKIYFQIVGASCRLL